jgi:hypothetical protein
LSFSYLTPENVFKKFKDSEKYMRPLFEPLSEYERLARNQPHPGIDKAYPKVTDGTLASIIKKTPRRIIQQVPTGKVEVEGAEKWLDIMAGWLLTNEILPHANTKYSLIEKEWLKVENGLALGSHATMKVFTKVDGHATTDTIPLYLKDVFLEPGKVSDKDSNYLFVRAWYQESDIDALIAKAETADEAGVDSDWHLDVLREIKTMFSQKDDLSTTPNEKQKNNRQGGIELIHCFQKGKKAKFYTIHVKTKQIARTKTNKDPRGKYPVDYFYAGVDGSNPLGRGFCEEVGSMQNLLDAEVQMYQYNRALMLNPPMIKRGNWNKNQAKLAPNVLVDLGSDQNSIWEPVKIDSTSLSTFPNNYGLMKSQILNLLSSPDTSISAEVGNPGFSKTDSGVKNQQAILSIDDNYIRKKYEASFEDDCETLINLYFAERSGVEEFTVDEATALKLKQIDPNLVNEESKVRIDFDSATPALHFTVDASSSNMKDNQQQMEVLDGLLERYEKAQTLQQLIPPEKIISVWNSLVTSSGVEDPEELSIEQEKDEQGNVIAKQPEQPTMQPEQVQQMIQDAIKQNDANDIANHPILKLMSSLNIKFTDLPEDSKHEVLNILGIPSNQQTPTQIGHSLSAIQTAHNINESSQGNLNQQAQMAQDQEQNQAQNELTAQGQQQQAETPPEQPTQPSDTMPSDNLTPEDQEYMQELLQNGLNEQQAGQALALVHHGYAPEDVLKMVGVA